MKLYDMKLAPNPRRVRIFMAEKGIHDVEKIEINIAEGENLQADYLAINPRGLLPTLELDDGTRLDETVAICRYLEELYPEPALMGRTPLEKAQVESMQRHIEFDGLMPLADVFRSTVPFFSKRAIPGQPAVYPSIPELTERSRNRFLVFLDNFDALMADRAYVAGDSFSIADITALCTIDFARAVKIRLDTTHENARRWHELVSARDSVAA